MEGLPNGVSGAYYLVKKKSYIRETEKNAILGALGAPVEMEGGLGPTKSIFLTLRPPSGVIIPPMLSDIPSASGS